MYVNMVLMSLRNKYGLKASDYAHTDEMKMVFKESPSVSTNPTLPKKIKSPQVSLCVCTYVLPYVYVCTYVCMFCLVLKFPMHFY